MKKYQRPYVLKIRVNKNYTTTITGRMGGLKELYGTLDNKAKYWKIIPFCILMEKEGW